MSRIQHLRIHGDNILECESALKLLASALSKNKTSVTFEGGSAFAPIYLVNSDTKEQFRLMYLIYILKLTVPGFVCQKKREKNGE